MSTGDPYCPVHALLPCRCQERRWRGYTHAPLGGAYLGQQISEREAATDEMLYQSPPLFPTWIPKGVEIRKFTSEEIDALDSYDSEAGC